MIIYITAVQLVAQEPYSACKGLSCLVLLGSCSLTTPHITSSCNSNLNLHGPQSLLWLLHSAPSRTEQHGMVWGGQS